MSIDKPQASPNDPDFFTRPETARILSVSVSQIIKWEHAGVLPVVRIPGIRCARHRATDVRSLAANITYGRLSTEPIA